MTTDQGGLRGITEWLANVKLEYVIGAIIVLFIIRLLLANNKTPAGRFTSETVESLCIAIALVFLVIRPFVVQAFYIPSGSMLPGLQLEDHILVNKMIYRFEEPKIGDVVVFKCPDYAEPSDPGVAMEVRSLSAKPAQLKEFVSTQHFNPDDVKDYIKRVEGLPGDVLQVKNGALYRNGQKVNEPYIKQDDERFAYIDGEFGPLKVPPHELFMMGDNRNNSNDCRFWGPLDRDRVVGKAWVRFYPGNRLGLIR